MLAVTVAAVTFMLIVAVVMARCRVRTVMIVFIVTVVVTSVRAMMIMVAMVTVMSGGKECLLGVVPCHVG